MMSVRPSVEAHSRVDLHGGMACYERLRAGSDMSHVSA